MDIGKGDTGGADDDKKTIETYPAPFIDHVHWFSSNDGKPADRCVVGVLLLPFRVIVKLPRLVAVAVVSRA